MNHTRNRIIAVEQRLAERHVPVAELLRQADIFTSTWTRWKNGTTAEPRAKMWRRIESALDSILAEPASEREAQHAEADA